MRGFVAVVSLCWVLSVLSEDVSPVEKVIELLEDLKGEVEASGKAEASTYDKFACFCKSTTKEKSNNIKTEQDNWDSFSATFDEQTGVSNTRAHEIKETENRIAANIKLTNEKQAMREVELEKYGVSSADLGHAVASLDGAIEQLSGSKPSLLSTKTTRTIRKSLAMADAITLSPKTERAVAALLQLGGDEAPEGDFEFHADDIIETMKGLQTEFKAKLKEVEENEGENKKDHKAMMKTLAQDKKDEESTLETKTEEKATADKNVAEAQENMDLEAAALADDQAYLQDLTLKCELKAREFDQRSKMRADEVVALKAATKIVKEKVKDNADDANKRSLVQVSKSQPASTEDYSEDAREELDEANEEEQLSAGVSFLQVNPRSRIRALVQRSDTSVLKSSIQDRVIRALMKRGKELGSPVITALALRMSADPFVKVKRLIQDLIQRLVQEAADEATKKGFCDTELGKANHERDVNFDKLVGLNAQTMSLEALKATKEEEISTLTTEIADLNESLTKTTKMRNDENAENTDTVEKATAGLAAVKDAYEILQTFYKKASKGTVSLAQKKASPVDEDAPASDGGAYTGGQQKSQGILAMLDVIISDFERTIKKTTETEKSALREFTEFDRTTRTSISSKETQKSQAEGTLKSAETQIVENMSSIEKHQKMLDDVLKEIEDLQPACVDTGMSYGERVQKRKDEIEALKKAMCELDPDKVEDQCK